jgi:ATP-dependent DNA helicase RecQ
VAGFGGLSVGAKGVALTRGEGAFRYRQDAVRAPVKGNKKTVPAPDRTGVSDALLQRLKSLRAKLARQRSVPAYVIFSDRTLIDMAAKRPLTRWDFGEVHGVGESKLQQFADIFLAELRDHVQAEAGVS